MFGVLLDLRRRFVGMFHGVGIVLSVERCAYRWGRWGYRLRMVVSRVIERCVVLCWGAGWVQMR